jgi:hypothetical protein
MHWRDIKLPIAVETVDTETVDFPSIQAILKTALSKFDMNGEEEEENCITQYELTLDITRSLISF